MESPPEDYPRHPPPHHSASRYRTFSTCWTASVNRKCEIYLRESLVGGEGGGRGDLQNVPFNNGSSHQLQTQNQDSQYHSAPLLFKQDLSNSYWWFMASFSEFILWREAIKGQGSQWPALSRLHCILQATPL